MGYGMTACLINGPPANWPEGHKWSSDWADVTCKTCLAGKELTQTVSISEDGKSMTCLKCGNTTHNQNDVDNHYCDYCHVFHDDIWPPARKAWLEGPTEGKSIEAVSARSCGAVDRQIRECEHWLDGIGDSYRLGKPALALGRVICLQTEVEKLRELLMAEK